MVETNNLFEVSMGKVVDQYGNLDKVQSQYYTKALSFQNEMNEKLGTNRAELEKYQAMYYSMFKSQGINLDSSYLMSESLTKAGYDIASLYNLSVEDSMNKLKSGLAGQVESLRQIGIDVSESSLTKVLNEVGITDRSVQQLSYAEKEVARYIAIMEQASSAQGDFAKTMDNSANQIKIFKNQIAELKQIAGSFIVNTFGNILVYVNAVIMVLKEILKSFANLFGYDLDTGGADLSTSLGVDDLSDGLGTATKKAKELKKQLMGFDEINNIDPNSTTSGGSSKGVATGIDDKLLNSLKEWDNKMSSISGKAQEIRDKMLDWLGFTRDVDGNLKWAWKDMDNIAKLITIVAGVVGGILIIGKITKLVEGISTLFKILTTGKGAVTTFGKGLQTIGKICSGMIEVIQLVAGGAGTLSEAMTAVFGSVATTITGIVAVIAGAGIAIKNFIDMLKNGFSWMKELFMIIGIAIAAVGAVILGVPAAIAAAVATIVGVVATLVVVIKEHWESIKKFFTETIPNDWEIFKKWLNKLPENIGYVLGYIAGAVYKFFTETIPDYWNNFMNWLSTKWNNFKSWLKELPGNINQKLTEIGENVNKFFTKTIPEEWNNFVTWIKGLPQKFVELGRNIIQGLLDGVNNSWNNFWEGVKQFINGFVQGFKEAVGVHSPSTVFAEIGKNIVQGLINGIVALKDKVIEKFTEIKNSIVNKITEAKTSVINSFTNMKNNVVNVMSIMHQTISNVVINIKGTMVNGFNTAKNTILSIFDGIRNGISEKINSAKNTVANQISNIKNLFNFSWSLPSLKTPHFSWYSEPASGKMADILSALGLPTSIPKLNIKWYAKGGMPDIGELFVARESGPEMVGKIGNKTTVANNDQIVTAIKQGVYEAVTSAMANGSNEVNINVTAEEGIIVKKASQGFKDYVMQTGELPFPVPIG